MRNVAETQVILPNGCWQGGACHREARVRGIPEDDEGLVDDLSAAALPVERATLLLARCVTGLGGRDGPGRQSVRDLSVGDREALLLHVRRLTFGAQMECVLPCPACNERMDFQLHVDQLLAPATAGSPPHYWEETVVARGVRLRVRFRIPTGADVEEALGRADRPPRESVQAVLARSVEWVRREGEPGNDSALAIEDWPAELMAQISERMAELDPQAEIRLQLTCPACQHSFTTAFDTGDYFLRELAARERRRYQEVHQLALAYHWSEADILNLSPRKRRLYLNLLSGELP